MGGGLEDLLLTARMRVFDSTLHYEIRLSFHHPVVRDNFAPTINKSTKLIPRTLLANCEVKDAKSRTCFSCLMSHHLTIFGLSFTKIDASAVIQRAHQTPSQNSCKFSVLAGDIHALFVIDKMVGSQMNKHNAHLVHEGSGLASQKSYKRLQTLRKDSPVRTPTVLDQ